MAKEKQESCAFRTSIGGQALIEGILMRGPEKQAIVCKTEDGFVEKVEELKFVKDRYPVLGLPLIRGVFTFLDSMLNGVKALSYSIDFAPEEYVEEPSKLDLWIEEKFEDEIAQKIIMGFAVVLGLMLSITLFLILPSFIVGFIPNLEGQYTLRTVLEGVVKLVIFFAYLFACSRMKDIQRVFAFHGAEHKTIFCYEKGLPLTVENVRIQSRFHPRCGTSFMFVVIIISIFTGMLIQVDSTLLRIFFRLCLLPIVVGVSYEINRMVGRHDNWFTAMLSWPGRQIQHFTTFEPDDMMIECAIRSLILVLPEEKGKDAW